MASRGLLGDETGQVIFPAGPRVGVTLKECAASEHALGTVMNRVLRPTTAFLPREELRKSAHSHVHQRKAAQRQTDRYRPSPAGGRLRSGPGRELDVMVAMLLASALWLVRIRHSNSTRTPLRPFSSSDARSGRCAPQHEVASRAHIDFSRSIHDRGADACECPALCSRPLASRRYPRGLRMPGQLQPCTARSGQAYTQAHRPA